MAKIPTTGITSDLVRDTVNSAGGSANDEWRNLCGEAAKYHKWARWKPRIWPADIVPVGDVNASPQSWRASDGWCGLKLPILNTLQSVKGITPEALWERNPPTGGTAAPYRIDDYGGYNSEARYPIYSLRRSGQEEWDVNYFDTPNYDILGVYCQLNDNRGSDALDLTDFAFRFGRMMLGELYFGLVFSKDDSNFCSYITLDKTINELIALGQGDNYQYPYSGGGMNVWAPSASLVNKQSGNYAGDGAYTIYPCLFVDRNPRDTTYGDVRGSSDTITLSNGFVPLPVQPIKINVVRFTSYVDVRFISAKRNTSLSNTWSTALDVTLEFTNNHQTADFLFSDTGTSYVRVAIGRYYEHTENPIYVYGSSQGLDFTLKAGETMRRTFTTGVSSDVPEGDGIALAAWRVEFVGNTIGPMEGFISQRW